MTLTHSDIAIKLTNNLPRTIPLRHVTERVLIFQRNP
jgi:hypothetical protein